MSNDNNDLFPNFSDDQKVKTTSNERRNPGGGTGKTITTTKPDGSQHVTETYTSSGGWSARRSWDVDPQGNRSKDHHSVNGQKRKGGKYK